MILMHDAAPTYGLEEEVLVVDQRQFEPVAIAPECLAVLERELGARFAGEYKATTIELVTGIHSCPLELTEEAAASREEAAAIVGYYGYRLLPLAAHPWAAALDMPARAGERYRQIEMRAGDAVRGLGAHGVHLHIGTIKDASERWRLTRRLMHLAPLHIAISAASPFWCGRSTNQASWRGRVLMQLASPLPLHVQDEADAQQLQQRFALAGGSQGQADDWSWLRPGAGKPTIEFRSFDTMPTLDHVAWLAALTAAVVTAERCGLLPAFHSNESSPSVFLENQRNATAHGADCLLIDPFDYSTKSVEETVNMWLDRIAPVIEPLGIAKALSTRPKVIPRTHRLLQRIADDAEAAARERGLSTLAAHRDGLLSVIDWALESAANSPTMPWITFPPLTCKELYQ